MEKGASIVEEKNVLHFGVNHVSLVTGQSSAYGAVTPLCRDANAPEKCSTPFTYAHNFLMFSFAINVSTVRNFMDTTYTQCKLNINYSLD